MPNILLIRLLARRRGAQPAVASDIRARFRGAHRLGSGGCLLRYRRHASGVHRTYRCAAALARNVLKPAHCASSAVPHALSAMRYDCVIDTQGLIKSALLARAAPDAHAYPVQRARAAGAKFYDVTHAVPRDLHAVERNRRSPRWLWAMNCRPSWTMASPPRGGRPRVRALLVLAACDQPCRQAVARARLGAARRRELRARLCADAAMGNAAERAAASASRVRFHRGRSAAQASPHRRLLAERTRSSRGYGLTHFAQRWPSGVAIYCGTRPAHRRVRRSWRAGAQPRRTKRRRKWPRC